MTSFTAEIKPVCACVWERARDFPGNISRRWISSATVESIKNSALSQNFFFLFLPVPLSSSNSNHRQHLFLSLHGASPNSLWACSKVGWKTPEEVHILSFGTAYERWKLRWGHATSAIALQAEVVVVSFLGKAWRKCRAQNTRDALCPAVTPICKRQSLMSGHNRDSTQSWHDVKKPVIKIIPTALKQQKENSMHQLNNNGKCWGLKPTFLSQDLTVWRLLLTSTVSAFYTFWSS